jgi:hypothetical protein
MKSKKTTNDSTESLPSDHELKNVLGMAYPVYEEIIRLTKDVSREWKYYGPKHGWQLKVSQKKKALLYLIPQKGSLRIGMAVREHERDALLTLNLPSTIKKELSASKKYAEGYPLRLLIVKKSDLKIARLVIDTVKAMRQ